MKIPPEPGGMARIVLPSCYCDAMNTLCTLEPPTLQPPSGSAQ